MNRSSIIGSFLIAAAVMSSGCTDDFFKPHGSTPNSQWGGSLPGTQKPQKDPVSKATFMTCMGVEELKGEVDALLDEANCPAITSLLDEAQKDQGILREDKEISADAVRGEPFPMAISLNANAIQKMFNASLVWAKSPYAVVDIAGCTKADFPQKLFNQNLTKDNCIIIRFDMNVMGYLGKVKLAVPIVSQALTRPDRVEISADMTSAQFVKFETSKPLDAYMGNVLENSAIAGLRNYMINVPLFDIAPWQFGNKELKFQMLEPKIHIDGAYEAVEIGVYTNLVTKNGVSIPDDANHGVDFGLHMTSELIQAVSGRMMTEKNGKKTYIPSTVTVANDGISEADQPAFEVTSSDIQIYDAEKMQSCEKLWENYLPLAYRLWSSDKYCGYQDLLVGLGVDIKNNVFQTNIGSLDGGKNLGAMSLTSSAFSELESTDFIKAVNDNATQSIQLGNLITIQTTQNVSLKASAATKRKEGDGFSFYSNLNGI